MSTLGGRTAFTVGALLIFRIGSYIPVPGIDLAAWNSLGNGGLQGLALCALGITPT